MDRKTNRGKLRVQKCNNTKDEIYELRMLAQKCSTQRAKLEQDLVEKGVLVKVPILKGYALKRVR